MVVWYLLITLSTGVAVIPQKDHQQCIDNRVIQKEQGVYKARCISGGRGLPFASATQDDD